MPEKTPLSRTARFTATLVVVLVPAAPVVGAFVGRPFGRTVLLVAAAITVVCLVASLGLLRRNAYAWPLVWVR